MHKRETAAYVSRNNGNHIGADKNIGGPLPEIFRQRAPHNTITSINATKELRD